MKRYIPQPWLNIFISLGLVLLFGGLAANIWMRSSAGLAASPAPSESSALLQPTGIGFDTIPTALPHPIWTDLSRLVANPDVSRTHLGVFTEQAVPAPTPLPSDLRLQKLSDAPLIRQLTFIDPITHQAIRFGNDSGDIHVQANTAQYVVWSFGCLVCDAPLAVGLSPGVYIYDRITHQQTRLKEVAPETRILLVGVWVIYADAPETKYSTASRAPRYTDVHAYNLVTRTDMLIGEKLLVSHGGMDPMRPETLFTACGTTIVWGDENTIYLYDLTTRTTQPLGVPNMARPHNFSCSSTLLTWEWFGLVGWWGYDRTNQTLFAFTRDVPAWQGRKQRNIKPVIVVDDQVMWSAIVDGQPRSVRASVVRK